MTIEYATTADLAGAVDREGDGWLCKVTGINPNYKTAAVGPTWKQLIWNAIDFDLFPLVVNDARCAVRMGIGGPPSGNFVFDSSGIYEFSAQIYLEPPQSQGANLSVYLGLFDLGTDGLGSTLIHVANEANPRGMHPSLKFEAPVLVQVPLGAHRYYAFRWYYLDDVTTSVNLQTDSAYCWADIARKCLL